MNWKLVTSILGGVVASSLVVVALAATTGGEPSGVPEETATPTDISPTATATMSPTAPSDPTLDVPSPKVDVCHVPPDNPDNAHTISVSEDALEDHLAHGDTEGACVSNGPTEPPGGDEPSPKVDVCHVPPDNPDNAHTISIGEDALEDHLAHGDTEGECP